MSGGRALRRASLVGMAIGLLAVAAATPGALRAQQPPPCAPLAPHELTNGDPASLEGAVRLPVDALGAFGRERAGETIFNPPGPKPPAPAMRGSALFASHVGRFLADDCVSGPQMRVVEATRTSLVTETQNAVRRPADPSEADALADRRRARAR